MREVKIENAKGYNGGTMKSTIEKKTAPPPFLPQSISAKIRNRIFASNKNIH